MPNYRRLRHPGGTYFFTVNLLQRDGNDLLTRHIDVLRKSVAVVRKAHPFVIHGWMVLPDHLNCVIELPLNDANFATRWRLIKTGFSKGLPQNEARNASRTRRGERGIWQRRFWEHLIRDEGDFNAHMDYVHINPVKHGLVKVLPTGHFRHSTHWWRTVFIQRIGPVTMRKRRITKSESREQ